MSTNRRFLDVHALVAGSMTGTSVLTSNAVDVSMHDMVSFQAVFTGTPNGTFAAQVSNDGGTDWSTVTLDKTLTAATGSAGSSYGQLNVSACQQVRLQYTNTSSTGTLDVYIVAKGA